MARRNLLVGMTFVIALGTLAAVQARLQRAADAQGGMVRAPMFEVDPLWPKPMPNHWLLGSTIGVFVDPQDTLEELTAFGDGGRQPGQFFGAHGIAVDSKGNIYTTETYEGKRLQKFVYKGIGMVPRAQGVIWPRR